MKPEFVKYNGHGMIERYPKSMSETYIIGHETRHRVHNQLKAVSSGETLSQESSYRISISGGSPVVTKGVTRSRSIDSKNSSDAFGLKPANSLSTLKKTKLSVEQKIRKLDATIKKNEVNPERPQAAQTETKRVEKQHLKNKNTRITNEISSIASDSKKENGGNTLPASASLPTEDFATLRQMSDIINDSFIFMQRNVPGVLLQDGPASGLKTQKALKTLSTAREPDFFDTKFTFHPDFVTLRARDLKEFESRLTKLDRAAGVLGDSENFMLKKASTSGSDAVSLLPSSGSPEGIFSIKINELARGETVVSDKYDNPFGSLNLSGSFSVNGYTISVSESDSLRDIANQINYGEDSNRNGTLDLAEDVNTNGTLDKIFIPGVMTQQGFTGSFSYFEDVDSDGQADPSEDLNNNSLLDGGTSRINVSASIERNRLKLQSTTANNISLIDNTGILKNIGFFTERGDGAIIKKDRQLLEDGTNLNVTSRRAELTVDGTRYQRESNQIDNIIPSTRISVSKKPQQSISASIKKDFSGLTGLIKEFKSSYNNVIQFINEQELSFKILDKDRYIQNARSRMLTSLKTSSPEQGMGELSLREIGLRNTNEKRRINQASLTSLTELVKKKSGSQQAVPFSGQNSLLSALQRTGVTKMANDQLVLDEELLNRSLENNLKETISLIAGKRGISSKIKSITEDFLNKVTGTLRLQQDVAKIYAGNQNILKTQQQQQGKIRSSKSQKSVLQSILSKGITSQSELPYKVKTDVRTDALS